MHYTSLNNGLGEHGVDGVREALQAIDDRDQDIGDAAVLELVHDAHPELCAFGLLDPDPEDFLGPVGQYAECDTYGFVADEAFVADFDSDRLEEHQRVTGIERAPLPPGYRHQTGVRDRRETIGRDVDAGNDLKEPTSLA